jgi:hypothetical protein
LAAWNGHTEVVAELLGIVNPEEEMPLVAGIDPNERDGLGRTALMLAAASGRDAVVELLIGYRCVDLTLVDQRGRTAQQLALDNGHLELFFTMSRWPEMDEPNMLVMPTYAEVLRDAAEDLQRHGLEINWDGDWGFGEMEMDIDDELWTLLNPDLPEDAGRAEYLLLEAARSDDRHAVEMYLNQNINNENRAVNLQAAARVAEEAGHVDLATYLSELVTDLNRERQERLERAQQHDEQIKYNANEVRLTKCQFTGEIPDKLCCPVAGVLMFDPVTVSTGMTYERDTLWKLMDKDEWCVCPLTRARIDRAELKNPADVCLLASIEDFVRSQENPEIVSDMSVSLTCPLTRQLFVDPVTVGCGLTFEREALKKWFTEHDTPDELLWQGEHLIQYSEIYNGSNVAIKSLVELHRAKLKADDMQASPRMDIEQVRAARLRIFDQKTASANLVIRNEDGESKSKKRK